MRRARQSTFATLRWIELILRLDGFCRILRRLLFLSNLKEDLRRGACVYSKPTQVSSKLTGATSQLLSWSQVLVLATLLLVTITPQLLEAEDGSAACACQTAHSAHLYPLKFPKIGVWLTLQALIRTKPLYACIRTYVCMYVCMYVYIYTCIHS